MESWATSGKGLGTWFLHSGRGIARALKHIVIIAGAFYNEQQNGSCSKAV